MRNYGHIQLDGAEPPLADAQIIEALDTTLIMVMRKAREAGDGGALCADDSQEVRDQGRKIVPVHDNLSTPTQAYLYEAFEPAEVRRIIKQFEWHDSPKRGSWLNLAGSELAVLYSQCLARRIADAATPEKEVDAWRNRRNTHYAKADSDFTSADAPVKLTSLYPSL